jgi:hypothetical protein
MPDDDRLRLRQWRDLCNERRDAQRNADEYPLFDDQGVTTSERLAEHDRLMDRVRDVQRRQIEFLAPAVGVKGS